MPTKYQQVRQLFTEAEKSSPATRKAKFARIVDLISAPDYGDGSVGHLLDGGVQDTLTTDLPTGIMRVPSLGRVFTEHSEINWPLLAQLAEEAGAYRVAYVAHVIEQALRRKSFPAAGEKSPAYVLHLNTYQRVPLYSETRASGVPASMLSGYGFPAVYASPAERQSEKRWLLSSCSRDILNARARQYLEYNRGVIYGIAIEPHSIFHADRKVNIRYQNWFIKDALRTVHQCGPSATELSSWCAAVRDMYTRWQSLDEPKAKLELAIEKCKELKFSFIGFSLFELIHEFLSEHSSDISWCNGGLIALDEQQSLHWSMRAFKMASSSDLAAMLQDRASELGPDALNHFWEAFDRHFLTKLKVFTGDNDEHLEECAFNNLFYGRLHEIQKEPGGQDPTSEPVPSSLVGSVVESQGLRWDATTQRIIFDDKFDDLVTGSALSTDPWDEWLRQTLTRRAMKLADLRSSEKLFANSLKLMLLNDVGPLAVPFQPDIRGELLLTPISAVKPPVLSWLVRVTEASGQAPNAYYLEAEEKKFDAPVLVRDRSSLDPLTRHLPDAMYLRAPQSRSTVYKAIFNRAFASVMKNLRRWLSDIPTATPISIVVVPFFKEKTSHLKVVAECVEQIIKRHEFAAVIFVSNQEPALFYINVAKIENRLSNYIRSGQCAIWPINTSEIAEMNYFMIEKFMNVHISAAVAQQVQTETERVRRTFFVEADISDAGQWLDTYYNETSALDATLFQFEVAVRDEGVLGAGRRNYSGSDAILAKLFAAPLTHVVFGRPIEQLFGGNFVLQPEALTVFVNCLDGSEHTESLLEAWLPSVMLRRTVRVLNVAPKIHLPALKEHLWSTDSKFVKWVFDLSFAIDHYLDGAAKYGHTTLIADAPPKYVFDRETSTQRASRARRAVANYGSSRQVYRDVLSEPLQDLFSGVCADAARKAVVRGAIDDDSWVETVFSFFLSVRGKALFDVEERLFALRALYDFKLLSMDPANPLPDVTVSDQVANKLRALL